MPLDEANGDRGANFSSSSFSSESKKATQSKPGAGNAPPAGRGTSAGPFEATDNNNNKDPNPSTNMAGSHSSLSGGREPVGGGAGFTIALQVCNYPTVSMDDDGNVVYFTCKVGRDRTAWAATINMRTKRAEELVPLSSGCMRYGTKYIACVLPKYLNTGSDN
jgi:hypothetical protein